MKKILLIFCLFSLVSVYVPGDKRTDIPQNSPQGKQLLSFTIPAATGNTKVGLSFSGKELYRWTGMVGVSTDSLKLILGNNQIPLQVEECDGKGIPLAKGNGLIDDDDNFYFAVTLSSKEQTLKLYHAKQTGNIQTPVSKVKIKVKPKGRYDLVLTTASLKIGIRSGGVGAGVKKFENFSRGAVAFFEWKGHRFADVGSGWMNCFPRAIGTSMDAPVWDEPKVVINGPVRTVVLMTCKGYERKEKGKNEFTGDITRIISLWNHAPIVDVENIVTYKTDKYNSKWHYGMTIPCGGEFSNQTRLIVPLDDKAYSLPVISSSEIYKEQPYGSLYQTDNPEEGWLAVINRKENVGLGFFYEKLESIRNRSRWVAYRPEFHPNIFIRTNPNDKIEIRMDFIDRAHRCRTQHRQALRYIGLSDQKPELIRQSYYSWALPLDQFSKMK